MKQEDKIQTIDGHTETVMKVEDKRIFTYENLNGWYHPAKKNKEVLNEFLYKKC